MIISWAQRAKGTSRGDDPRFADRRRLRQAVGRRPYACWPKGPLPDGYLPVAPELVVEVLSPDDRWSDVHEKTSEYLNAGVSVVCIIDPRSELVHNYYPDQSPRILSRGDELSFPQILGDFRIAVERLFAD